MLKQTSAENLKTLFITFKRRGVVATRVPYGKKLGLVCLAWRSYSTNNETTQVEEQHSKTLEDSTDINTPVNSLSSRSSMILSNPNAVLNKNIFPVLPSTKELKYMSLSPEDREKHIMKERKREEQQYNAGLRKNRKLAKSNPSPTNQISNKEESTFDELLTLNQFHRIKPYTGKSVDEQIIKEYVQFLEVYPSIRLLNTKLDTFAKKEKHSLSEPIFKQLIYFLTHVDIAHLKSMNLHILRPNHYTFNMMMMSYLTVGDIPAVQSLYSSIESWVEKKPSYVNFVTLLTAYCRVGNLKILNELFRNFVDGKIALHKIGIDNPEAVTSVFTVLMKALLDIGEISKVEEIYNKFLSLELTPSQHMRNIMLNVYRQRRNYEKCVDMFESYQKAYKPDRHILQTMMGVYGSMGKIEEMEKLFASIEKPNDFTFITMTNAYCNSGLDVQAEECFSRVGNRDDKLLCKMMELYSRKGNTEKLDQMFSLIRKPTTGSIYIYIDGISMFGNFDKVNELVKTISPESYSGKIWVCHLQSAVKTTFTNADLYFKRVQNIFDKKPNNISEKDNRFAMKLYKLALGKHLSHSRKSDPTQAAMEKPITEIYREFAEKKVQMAERGVDEGKFQTRDSFHEQFVLNNDSIYRPDYVSPYELFLDGYYRQKKKDEPVE